MKTKNILTLLYALLISAAANAYDAQIDGIYYNFSGNEASVTYKDTNHNSYSGDIAIPESVVYNGITYSVTSIGLSAFSGCTGLTSITIPTSVRLIDGYAFYQCNNLTTVNIPNSVTSIGYSAFENCTGLTSITIPESVNSIGNNAFYGTAWYKNQPDGLIYAGKVAYKYIGTMPEGTEIVLEEGTLGIAVSAFSGCSGLISMTIPESVISIGNYAFSGCSDLTSITIPNSVVTIGSHVFSGCKALTSVTIPENVIFIEDYAFYQCSGLTSITIPNSVTSIGDDAFYGCSSLTNVIIGDGVSTIGQEAFYNCTGMKSITMGNGIIEIGAGAFQGCNELTSVHISDLAAWCGISFLGLDGNYNICASNPLSGCNKNNLYINGEVVTDLIIPNDVTSIGGGAFAWGNWASVTIPESVTSIGNYAFAYCRDLTSVTIPNSVTSIGKGAFDNCSGLTSVTIGSGVTNIEPYAFSNLENIKSFTVGMEDPCTISEYVFGNYTHISSCTLYVPIGCKAVYGGARYWSSFKEILEVGEETIDDPSPTTNGLVLAGDLNGDGEITIADVTALVNIILGKGPETFTFYYGVINDEDYWPTSLEGLTKCDDGYFPQKVQVNGYGRSCFAYPTKYGTLKSIKDQNGFDYMVDFEKAIVDDYYVYILKHCAGLGGFFIFNTK